MIWCEAVLVKPILTRKCCTKVKTCFESKRHEQSENTFLDDGRMVAMFALGVTTSSTLFALSIKCRTNPDCMISATVEEGIHNGLVQTHHIPCGGGIRHTYCRGNKISQSRPRCSSLFFQGPQTIFLSKTSPPILFFQ
jgi:hypothetical protein